MNDAAAPTGTSATDSGVGSGGAAGGSQSGWRADAHYPSTAQSESGGSYSLRGVYFRREWFPSTADCLTSAYARRLPLEVCQ